MGRAPPAGRAVTVDLAHSVSFALDLEMSPAAAVEFARDVPRTLSRADFLADLQVITGDPSIVTAAIPVSAAMFGQRELPFRSVLEHTAHGARLRSLDIEPDGPGWALVSGEARVTPVGQGARQTARIDYRFEITVRLKLPKAERWGQRALTRMIEFTAKTVLSQVAEKLPGAVARAAGVAAVVA